jgi:hypothetical protein
MNDLIELTEIEKSFLGLVHTLMLEDEWSLDDYTNMLDGIAFNNGANKKQHEKITQLLYNWTEEVIRLGQTQ